jgi:hypothetical protein
MPKISGKALSLKKRGNSPASNECHSQTTSRKAVTLFSYIVTHDTGFAPNPFAAYCTLACCKPAIRRKTKEGDWIVGLTPKAKGHRIVYYMRVEEIMSFDAYWRDLRFRNKKPKLNSGNTRACGDNIYEPQAGGEFRQLSSMHSKPRFGKHANRRLMRLDLGGRQVLISEKEFAYFGSEPKALPPELKCLIVGRNHKCHFPPEVVEQFVHHFVRQFKFGVHGSYDNSSLGYTEDPGVGPRVTGRGKLRPAGTDETHTQQEGL